MDNFKRLPNEGPKAYDAFIKYCEMGPDRSLSKLGNELSKSKSLLSRWSTKYSWVDRSDSYDMRLNEVRMNEREQEIMENERLKAEIGKKLLEKGQESLEKIDPHTLKPLEALKMIVTGVKIEKETMKDIIELEEKKLANNQNEIKIVVVDSKGNPYKSE